MVRTVMTNTSATQNKQIEKYDGPDSPLNFSFLRRKGIEIIQQISGEYWTDYNLHDPGVTILEHLCFAITDLAYRTTFPVPDLLADKDGNISKEKNLFFERDEILTTSPLHTNDFRKIIIDNVPEVYNVWIEPVSVSKVDNYTKGVYRVVAQVNNDTALKLLNTKGTEEEAEIKRNVIKAIEDCILDKRSIGEDFEQVLLLEPKKVTVSGEVIINRHAQHEDILADIYYQVATLITPPIHFYTEAELLARGLCYEEIYNGPFLQHGFLLDEELMPRTTQIDPSDFIRSVSAIEGVLYVKNLKLIDGDTIYENKPFVLGANEFALFEPGLDSPQIKLIADNYTIHIRHAIFISLFHKKSDAVKRSFNKQVSQTGSQLSGIGVSRQLKEYHSFQYLFPAIYRLNIEGMEDPEENKYDRKERVIEKAKSKQLKAYLMLFEQVLANYLAQLANISHLFSPNITKEEAFTYYVQPLYNVPGAENIIHAFFSGGKKKTAVEWGIFKKDLQNSYISNLQQVVETDDVYSIRKNKAIDHLLSRFNINLNRLPVEIYERLYNPGDRNERISEVLLWKAGILKEIAALTQNRYRAYSYADRDAIDYDYKMRKLLYIQNNRGIPLTAVFNTIQAQQQTGKSSTPGTEKLNWDNEAIELVTGKEEMQQLLGVEGNVTGAPYQVAFKEQGRDFFTAALDSRNYKVGPDYSGTNDYLLIYKPPQDTRWKLVGRFPDKKAATQSIRKIINTVRDLNTQSEGFHVVEHILLRPSFQLPVFGFNFRADTGQVLFRHDHWLSFDQRAKALDALFAVTEMEEGSDYKTIADKLFDVCNVNISQDETSTSFIDAKVLADANPQLATRVFNKIRYNLDKYRNSSRMYLPAFNTLVLLPGKTAIMEDFFNFRITVVLPEWTARFQDNGFRQFAEKIFAENTPAHLRIHFKWLSLAQMKTFEEMYFAWLPLTPGDSQRNALAVNLISFLADKEFMTTA